MRGIPLVIVTCVALAVGGCRSTSPATLPPAGLPAPTAEAPGARRILDPRLQRLWPDDPSSTAWFDEHDEYRIYAREPGRFVAIRAPVAAVTRDLTLTGTFRKVGGPPGGGYGLIVRRQSVGAGDGRDQLGQFIVAAVGDRGEVGIWRRDGERWLDLLPWTASSAVRSGSSPNQLAVRVNAGRLEFKVNGSSVASVPIGLADGDVGVFTGGDFNEVVVDELQLETAHSTTHAIAADARSLANRQDQVAAASARLSALSTAAPRAGESEDAWRANVADSVASLQRIGQEVEFEFGGRRANAQQVARVRDLMGGIAEDVEAIADAFSTGFDGPKSPVNNAASLAEASSHLKSAAHKAEQVRAELSAMHGSVNRGDRGR